jgi:hypothetical protein
MMDVIMAIEDVPEFRPDDAELLTGALVCARGVLSAALGMAAESGYSDETILRLKNYYIETLDRDLSLITARNYQ